LDRYLLARGNELAWFLDALISAEDLTGHDQRLGFLGAFRESPSHKNLICPFLVHFSSGDVLGTSPDLSLKRS